jgi:hypothetical protein
VLHAARRVEVVSAIGPGESSSSCRQKFGGVDGPAGGRMRGQAHRPPPVIPTEHRKQARATGMPRRRNGCERAEAEHNHGASNDCATSADLVVKIPRAVVASVATPAEATAPYVCSVAVIATVPADVSHLGPRIWLLDPDDHCLSYDATAFGFEGNFAPVSNQDLGCRWRLETAVKDCLKRRKYQVASRPGFAGSNWPAKRCLMVLHEQVWASSTAL